MINKNIISDNDLNVSIKTCKNLLVDVLKDIEYLSSKKTDAESWLSDSEFQELQDARVFADSLKTTINYMESIL